MRVTANGRKQSLAPALGSLTAREESTTATDKAPGCWLWDLEDSDGDDGDKPVKAPADDSDCAEHIYREYLLPRTEEYSSESIEAYFERRDRARAELDRDVG